MTSLTAIASLFVVMTTLHTWASEECEYIGQTGYLDCRGRGLRSVPVHQPHFNEALSIDLSSNNFEVIRISSFSRASHLRVLDLTNSNINALELGAFQGLTNLVVLNMSANDLHLRPSHLKPNIFDPLQALEEFRFQTQKKPFHYWNGIDKTFRKLKKLKTLFLDLPDGFVFGPGFGALKDLSVVSTSGRPRRSITCFIRRLTNETFAIFKDIHLKELRLINCGISTIEPGALDVLKSLHTLDLTNNIMLGLSAAIHSLHVFEGRVMEEIKLARLNYGSCPSGNHFAVGEGALMQLGKLCIKNFDVSENFITYIDHFKVSQMSTFLECVEKFNMSFHSLRCPPVVRKDSSINFTIKSIDVSNGFDAPKVDGDVYIEYTITDKIPQKTLGFPSPNVTLPPSLKELNLRGISYWSYLDSSLKILNGWNLTSLDIANNRLGNCDGSMINGLGNLTKLDVSVLQCSNIHPNYFKSFPKLAHLSLSNSPHVGDILRLAIHGPPFVRLGVLEAIDLTGDNIVDLHPDIFVANKHLQSINLANNKLQRLPRAIWGVGELAELDLSSNAFTHFIPKEMEMFDKWMLKTGAVKPFRLLLVNNPIECTCDTVLFVQWLLDKRPFLDITESTKCALSNGSWVEVFKFGDDLTSFKVNCVSETYLVIGVVGSSVLVVLILVFAGIYRYRLNLRYWLYTKLNPPQDMFSEDSYNYDVFVAYTEDNYMWTKNELCKKLESSLLGDPLRLCVHDRDFIPGLPIHENIVDKMRQSRRILFLVSRAFLKSMYGPLEIEYAVRKSLEEGREDVIVCVLMEDIPVRQMPKALRNLWHKITFLTYRHETEGQVIFWRNIREALK